ncbi:MAG: hypothetical protein GY851_35190 [bacterium]|nr:hypothetical protein [bacterium]
MHGPRDGLTRRRLDRAGVSLLEMVTAIFVLTVGVLGVVQMFHYGIDKTHTVHEANLATRALRNEIETLRAVPFRELTDTENAPFRSVTPELAKLMNATPAVTIESDPGGTLGLKQITVSLAWTGEHGRTVRKQLVTLVADRGAGQ